MDICWLFVAERRCKDTHSFAFGKLFFSRGNIDEGVGLRCQAVVGIYDCAIAERDAVALFHTVGVVDVATEVKLEAGELREA